MNYKEEQHRTIEEAISRTRAIQARHKIESRQTETRGLIGRILAAWEEFVMPTADREVLANIIRRRLADLQTRLNRFD
ncbi:hypothetical protein COV82_06100 [Candidatus Peregrinibacteria bacterium CG11_big_fil_rev_8_21_14_0_20_46_8]|nr:MAG: hypothetical protein COV82_06100 [Candidatus Peregrinibacteria bacterium CG11_big_fil_rev_8_21_14_0_20_46_8]